MPPVVGNNRSVVAYIAAGQGVLLCHSAPKLLLFHKRIEQAKLTCEVGAAVSGASGHDTIKGIVEVVDRQSDLLQVVGAL